MKKTQAEFALFCGRIGVMVAAAVFLMALAKAWFLDPYLSQLALYTAVIPEVSASDPQENASERAPIVSWRLADEYIGTYAGVEGEVVATYNSGSVCYLNFHENYQQHFTAVIFADDFPQFPRQPEEYYLGQHVRVYGTIKEYKGRPEIILDSPGQIKLIE